MAITQRTPIDRRLDQLSSDLAREEVLEIRRRYRCGFLSVEDVEKLTSRLCNEVAPERRDAARLGVIAYVVV